MTESEDEFLGVMPWQDVAKPSLSPHKLAGLVHEGTLKLLGQISTLPRNGVIVTRGGLLMEHAIHEFGLKPGRLHPGRQEDGWEGLECCTGETWIFDVISDTGATLLSVREQLRLLGLRRTVFCCIYMTSSVMRYCDTLGIKSVCLETIGDEGFVRTPSEIPYDFGDIATYIGLA